jgi:hypothetical protein
MTTGQQDAAPADPRTVLTAVLDAVWNDLEIAPSAEQIIAALAGASLAIVPVEVPPLAELVTDEDLDAAREAADLFVVGWASFGGSSALRAALEAYGARLLARHGRTTAAERTTDCGTLAPHPTHTWRSTARRGDLSGRPNESRRGRQHR